MVSQLIHAHCKRLELLEGALRFTEQKCGARERLVKQKISVEIFKIITVGLFEVVGVVFLL